MLVDLIAKTVVIKFKVITEDVFIKITTLFDDLLNETIRDFPNDLVECLYEIRIGNENYSGPSFGEFKKQYEKNYTADNIRLTIQATSTQQQINPVNAKITIVLDRVGESSFVVLGRNNNWANGVFNRFNELLSKVPNRNVILHNVVLEMIVQLVAVIVITTFPIYAANRLAGIASIQYSEVYIFVIIFLLLSNAWTYIARGLIAIRNAYYPMVDIRRHARKPIILAVLSFIGLAAATWAINYLLDLLMKK